MQTFAAKKSSRPLPRAQSRQSTATQTRAAPHKTQCGMPTTPPSRSRASLPQTRQAARRCRLGQRGELTVRPQARHASRGRSRPERMAVVQPRLTPQPFPRGSIPEWHSRPIPATIFLSAISSWRVTADAGQHRLPGRTSEREEQDEAKPQPLNFSPTPMSPRRIDCLDKLIDGDGPATRRSRSPRQSTRHAVETTHTIFDSVAQPVEQRTFNP